MEKETFFIKKSESWDLKIPTFIYLNFKKV